MGRADLRSQRRRLDQIRLNSALNQYGLWRVPVGCVAEGGQAVRVWLAIRLASCLSTDLPARDRLPSRLAE